MENALDIQKIYKNFKDKKILEDISFSIKKGEIFGLIGVNGIGKTTLIKIIVDLLKADSGSVKIFSKESIYKEARKNIVYLPEKFNPSSNLKGHEFLSISLGYFAKKYNKEIAFEYADKLDLSKVVLNQKISKYSKGMGQKLGLISSFMSNSPLLILDEPMSGLDPHVRIKLKDELRVYAKEKGNTVFFSSHILSDIDEICDRIGVISKGKLCFVGTGTEYKKKYKASTLERAFLETIKE